MILYNQARMKLSQLLKLMTEKGASDLHITTATAPQLRICCGFTASLSLSRPTL